MNGLNESDVTKVTCMTNVTCVTNVMCVKNVACVTNERDEQIWRNTVFVFRAKRLRRHLRGRIAFQTDTSTCYSAPSQKPNGKAQKKWRKRATSKRSNRVQRIFRGCCVRQTIRVSLKANAYCSALPVSEHVRGLSSLTWCVSCYISTSSPIYDSQPFFYPAGNGVPQYMPSELHNYSANVNHFCLP